MATLVFVLMFSMAGCGIFSKGTTVESTSEYLMESIPSPSVGNGGEWNIMMLSEAGVEVTEGYYEDYYENILAHLKTNNGVAGDPKSLTDTARVSMALKAMGKDPSNINGYDLLAPLENTQVLKDQGVNAVAYALIASNYCNYPLSNEKDLLDILAEESLHSKDIAGDMAEVDYRAMMLQGFSYYLDRPEYKEAIDFNLEYLRKAMQDDGSYGNCESTAQTIMALSMMGYDLENETDFTVDGKTLLDGLKVYEKDGGYSHLKDSEKELLSSQQGLMAMIAVNLQKEGKGLFRSK